MKAATPLLLRIANLRKSFGAVQALRGVSFELRAGEVHALLGENGAGKSTLIKVLTGAVQRDGGELAIGGTMIAHVSPGNRQDLGIACIYQQPALFPELTVTENIALRLERSAAWERVRWKARHARARELLQSVGADIDPRALVRELSMPEQQLVEIACAMGAEARVVIMDEPTASLTQREQERLFAIVRELRARGAGVIYISHRLEEVFALADRVTVLRDGASVGTCAVHETSEAALISMMVGRHVEVLTHRGQSPRSDTVLSLRDVGCAVSGVHKITFELRAGETLGLAGLIGAGRTELARVLFGITPADAGEIRVRGEKVAIRSPQAAVEQGIAYVPEDRRRHGVIPELAISANTTMAVHQRLFPGGWLRFKKEQELASHYIRELDVKASGTDAPVSSLSGGNQQKISIARWLATQPRILILDEPTQGVDIGAKVEIHKIIRQLAEKGLAVLLISSDLPEILAMSDRIGVMRGGAITSVLQGNARAEDVMSAALGRAA